MSQLLKGIDCGAGPYDGAGAVVEHQPPDQISVGADIDPICHRPCRKACALGERALEQNSRRIVLALRSQCRIDHAYPCIID